jgi:hypothetical protein
MIAGHLAAAIFGGLIRVRIAVAVVVVRLLGGQGLEQRGEQRFGLPLIVGAQGFVQKLLQRGHRVASRRVPRLTAACAVCGERDGGAAKHADVKACPVAAGRRRHGSDAYCHFWFPSQ